MAARLCCISLVVFFFVISLAASSLAQDEASTPQPKDDLQYFINIHSWMTNISGSAKVVGETNHFSAGFADDAARRKELTYNLEGSTSGLAADEGEEESDLAQESSNPVGAITMFHVKTSLNLINAPEGPYSGRHDTALVVNVQPVIPVTLSEDWRMLVRPVIPLISQPYRTFSTAGGRRGARAGLVNVDTEYRFGLGDIILSTMFSPVIDESTGFIGGFGPSMIFPTATDDILADRCKSLFSANP